MKRQAARWIVGIALPILTTASPLPPERTTFGFVLTRFEQQLRDEIQKGHKPRLAPELIAQQARESIHASFESRFLYHHRLHDVGTKPAYSSQELLYGNNHWGRVLAFPPQAEDLTDAKLLLELGIDPTRHRLRRHPHSTSGSPNWMDTEAVQSALALTLVHEASDDPDTRAAALKLLGMMASANLNAFEHPPLGLHDGHGRRVSQEDPHSLLYHLADTGRFEAFDSLLTNSPPAKRDLLGNRAVHYAARFRRIEALRHLAPDDLSVTNRLGMTPLQWASFESSSWPLVFDSPVSGEVNAGVIPVAPVVDHLRAAGARFDAFSLAALGDRDRLAALLDNDPRALSRRDSHGRSLLHWAAYARRPNTLQLLIERRADLDVTNTAGDTALHWANAIRFTDGVNLLKSAGADSSIRNYFGQTPGNCRAGHATAYVSRVVTKRKYVEYVITTGLDPYWQPDSNTSR